MVLMRHDDRPVRKLLLPAQLKERQRAEPRMRGDEAPLVVRQSAGLVEYFRRHARLSDVVKERGHAEIIQLNLAEPKSLAQRHREDADVDAMRERVLVVIADGRETDQRGFLIEYLIDDALHDPFDLLDVRAAPEPHRRHQILRHGDGLGIRLLRHFLRLLAVLLVNLLGHRFADLEHAQFLLPQLHQQLREAHGRLVARRHIQEGEKALPFLQRRRAMQLQRADARGAKHREQMAEACIVVEVETQPDGVDEHELAGDAHFQLMLAIQQFSRQRRQLLGRILHGDILQRIQSNRAERGVEGEDEPLSRSAHIRVTASLDGMASDRRLTPAGRRLHVGARAAGPGG